MGHERNPNWSPDGSKIAFVSNRVDHSLIGVYDVRDRAREVPVAERRSRHQPDVVARRHARRVHPSSRHAVRPAGAPGTAASIGNPDGPAYNPLTALRAAAAAAAAAVARGAAAAATAEPISASRRPGSDRRGVHRRLHAFVLGGGRRDRRRQGVLAQPAKDDKEFNAINAIQWAGADHVIFEAEPQEWMRVVFGQRDEQPSRAPR